MPSWYDDVRSAACLLDSRRDQLPAGHLDKWIRDEELASKKH